MSIVRRSVAVTTWGVATVVVCTLAWTAVDRVAADVTDHPTVVGNAAIRDELRPRAGAARRGPDVDLDPSVATAPDGSPAPGTSGTGATDVADPGGSGTSDPAGGAAAPGTASGATGGTRSRSTGAAPGAGTGPGTPTTTATAPPPPPPPSPPPPTTPTTTPTGPAASVVTAGGSVTAACSGGTPRLVQAVPNAGYGVSVRDQGDQLIVTLRSSRHFSVVEIECEGTRVHFSTSEESTD